MPDLSHLPFQRIASTPYVEFAAGPDARGQWWISCRCRLCGPSENFLRPCSQPRRTMEWVGRYASMHGHVR